MASRHFKRVLQQQTLQEAELLAQAESSDNDEVPIAAPFNPFDLLLSDEDANEVTSDQQNEEEQEGPAEQPTTATIPTLSKRTGPAKGGKKAAKKKGKGKQDPVDGQAAGSEQRWPASHAEEDIDKLVQELNLQTVGAATSEVKNEGDWQETSSLLGVDPQALRGDNELRRIFGAGVISAVDREEVAEAAGRRRMAGAQPRGGRPGAAGALRRIKRGVLVTPRDHWPAWEGGLGMEFLGIEDGVKRFRYTWSPAYRHTQRQFEQCQASFDPNSLAALLHQSPFHVDSLMTMYELYRNLGENNYAEEVLLRALHALEAAWHSQFDIKTANCRLDFEVSENRPLFFALFRHVQALSRAGCHRTALEAAKLLLALEPDDPLGVTCMADYLALRAGAHAWVYGFVASWDADAALALRPNWAFALAMAGMRLDAEAAAGGPAVTPQPERIPAATQLLNAIFMHPSIVPRLVGKLQDKGAARESHWAKLLARKLFTQPHDAACASLQHLGLIYVERSALLWKAPDALEMLREVATRAADLAEAGAIQRNRVTQSDEDDGGLGAEDWAAVRRSSFPDSTTNEYAHLRLADFSDNVNALPREELGGAPLAAPPAANAGPGQGQGQGMRRGQRGGFPQLEGFEGLPDDIDEETLMQLQQHILMAQQGGGAEAGVGVAGLPAGANPLTAAELQDQNPLMMLLRSLLPWVDAGVQPDYAAQDEEGGQPGQAGQPGPRQ